MKIVVVGGSGLIGTKLVKKLRERGHEPMAASPRTGVNTVTGEGLAAAMQAAQIVVDVSNPPSFEEKAAHSFFETSARNLLAAEAAAGVRHHIALSIVGADRLRAYGYMRAKLAQEAAIEIGKTPYTVLRATQFFEFIGSIVDASTDGTTVRLSSALFQPIAADDVATALVDLALSTPANGTTELAGPDSRGLDVFARQLLRARQDPRAVVTDTGARYFGVPIDDRSLRPGDGARIGPTHFEEWLVEHVAPASPASKLG